MNYVNFTCADECVSCGENATYYCKECEAMRCQICNEMWHKHKSRRNHSIEVNKLYYYCILIEFL